MSGQSNDRGDASKPSLLLRDLGREPAAERNSAEREALFALRIDAQLVQLGSARRRSRQAWLALGLAAAVPLAFFGSRALLRPGGLSIDREPNARRPAASISRAAPALGLPQPVPPASATPQRKARIRSNPAPLSSDPRTTEPAAPSPNEAPSEASAGSTLGRENQLFSKAVNAARSGNVEQALSGFTSLLAEYPNSPLAQTALVRKFRLLDSTGRKVEARAEADRYLRSYPTGFAEREARALSKGETPTSTSLTDDGGTP